MLRAMRSNLFSVRNHIVFTGALRASYKFQNPLLGEILLMCFALQGLVMSKKAESL